jgi:type IV secretion system protein VirB4
MLSTNRLSALRREPMASERIPCSAHVAPNVVKTVYGDYVQVIRLDGVSFETADDDRINNWHERLNVLWRNIASSDVALWTHVVRRRARNELPREATRGFSSSLDARYAKRLAGETLMINELYLSLVYRPAAGAAKGVVSRLLTSAQTGGLALELSEALDVCGKLTQSLLASLARYDPETLGSYRIDSIWYSSLLEFFGLLINGEWRRTPLPHSAVNEVLATTRLLFGTEAIEYRTPTATRVGAILGIKEYPSPTTVGMYNRLLTAPFPLVLTQSFVFLTRQTSQGLLQRQFHRMANAGDFAVSQAEQLKDALDGLSSNEFVMGDHHFSLQVLCDLADDEEGDRVGRRLRALNDNVALARAILADTGMTVAREDLALEAAFWAQLPGNLAMRPRKAPITSRNFAAMVPFHNYPSGRALGNHWGSAVALLMTNARSPYYFSLHASDPADREGAGPKDTGHTFICGPTGSGKTVLIGFLVSMLERQGVSQVIFDKDRGLEILVRALGGEYLPLSNGSPTGFNPLQLPVSALHLEFLKAWLRLLVRPADGRALSAREQSDLDQALHGTLALDRPARRLSRLIEFLDPTDPEGIHARLVPWCEVSQGDYAWVFDNSEDSVVARIAERAVIGFDVTDFLENDLTRPPVTLYLFHLVRQLLDGRRLVCWMDEFWRLLADRAFETFAKDGPKTWRKLNGVMCVATQSPSDVLLSPISRTIIEQTPTKIFFPNANADAAEYASLGLTDREIRLINEQLEPGSRCFLVKQGQRSVVCQLDLKGFDAELRVISGRVAQVRRMEQLIETHGPEPSHWLPQFMSPATAA